MAKVNYRSQFSYSFAGQAVQLRAKISIGASGAPTLVAGTGMGIDTVTHAGTGRYVLTLSQAFSALMSVRVISNAGSSAPAAPIVSLRTDNSSNNASPQIEIDMRNLSGTLTDPASGEVLLVELCLNRSSLSY